MCVEATPVFTLSCGLSPLLSPRVYVPVLQVYQRNWRRATSLFRVCEGEKETQRGQQSLVAQRVAGAFAALDTQAVFQLPL